MKKSPAQSDAIRLQSVLDILGITAFKLAKSLGYKSPSSIYNVLGEDANLSQQMAIGIITHHPSVNYRYLTQGIGEPILKHPSEVEAQRNLFGIPDPSKLNKTNSDNEEVSRPPSPEVDYNSYPLRLLLENSYQTNSLLKEILEENKKLREIIEKKNL